MRFESEKGCAVYADPNSAVAGDLDAKIAIGKMAWI